MIFYFSGSGNSQAAAEAIATFQNDQIVSIVQAIQSVHYHYALKPGEKVIFVFPVYAWAPPEIVSQFISHVTFGEIDPDYISVVVTYSKQTGDCLNAARQLIEKRGWQVTSFYSLKMPHNYLIVGQVDSYEVAYQKLVTSVPTLREINQSIAKKEEVFKEARGLFPRLRTKGGSFLFRDLSKGPTSFFANDHCISCKVCEKICPTNCIKVKKKPKWEGKCIKCLACLHYCPKSAIQYGKKMEHKKRYTHPDVLWHELNQCRNKNRQPKF